MSDYAIRGDGLAVADRVRRRVSWGALFAGVVIAITVQFLLSLLGAGIGLSTVDVARGSTPDASTFGIGAGVWWIVSGVISLFIGGFVAARLSGVALRFDGLLHGVVTWALATLLTVWLLTSAIGGVLSGGASVLGGLASAAGSGVKAAAQPVAQAAGITPESVQQEAQSYLQPANQDPAAMTPEQAQKAIATNLATYAKGGPDAAAAKDRIVAIMAAQQKVSQDQARQQFEQAQAKLQQVKQQAVTEAKQAADASAAAAAKTSFAAFGTFLIGAIAGAIGGAAGTRRAV